MVGRGFGGCWVAVVGVVVVMVVEVDGGDGWCWYVVMADGS